MRTKTILAGLLLGALAGLAATASAPAAARDDDRGQVSCGSVDGRSARCPVGWRDAQLVRQDSDTRCVRGQNWGFERGAIWVDKGCRGRFVAARGGDWGGGGRGRETSVSCGSVNNRYQLCRVRIDRGASVRLVNNDSDVRCRQGDNWGVNRDGIWVDRGCRGRFVISGR